MALGIFGAKDLVDFTIDNSDAVYITADYYKTLGRSHIKGGDVLLSIMGTVGNLAVVPKEFGPCTANRAIAIIRPRSTAEPLHISPEYLVLFLASNIGVGQRGAFVGRRSSERINWSCWAHRIPLIRGFVQRNCRHIQPFSALVRKATLLFSECGMLVEEELGLNGHPSKKDAVGSSRTLGDVVSAGRWDSEFYRYKYDLLIRKCIDSKTGLIKGFTSLRKFITFLTNGHTPLRHDLSEGPIPFITAEHVSDFRVDFRTEKRILRVHHNEELARTKLHDGDILLTIEGKIGNCALFETVQPTRTSTKTLLCWGLRRNYILISWLRG